jgi:nucleoside-diphosphate-sugar epimerase
MFIVVITGGAGFLGQALLRELSEPGSLLPCREIRVFDIKPASETKDRRTLYIRGDVRDYQALRRAIDGADIVFHLAALVDWGTHPKQTLYDVNVGGTQNVITACKAHGIGALVYTSSEDAIYPGRAVRDADESLPYPSKFPNAYCSSKAEAEKLVTAANGSELRTAALRPGGIYGEGDPYHLPPLIRMARRGFYMRIGSGEARCQNVYVGNVARAHAAAARALLDGNAKAAGGVYFVTDSPPENFFVFLDRIVRLSGYSLRPENLWIPSWIMYALGCLAEAAAFLLRPIHRFNPGLSRFAVRYTSCDFTFSGRAARRDLDYEPRYPVDEAAARTATFFKRKAGKAD